MKAFKATDKDGKCRGMLFQVGKIYTMETKANIELCKSGFHFCQNLFDVYSYYPKTEETRVFEIEALGEIKSEGDKSVTNKIQIVRELSTLELLKAWITRTNSGYYNSGDWNSGDGNSGYNSGDWNSGDGNSGYYNSGGGNSGNYNSGNYNSGGGNSGNYNSGNYNSGDGNSGYGNSGNRNSGDWNSGYYNSGNYNSGNYNSGYGNSGNRNSGDWNSGDGNSGYFNTMVPIYFFNKPSNVKHTHELERKIRSLNVKPIVTYIESSSMTEEEKTNNPSHNTTGGFLRKTDRMNWNGLTDQDKEFIKSLPNFDDDVFEKISGIRLTKPKTIKIIVNGIEKEISYEHAKASGLID